jgi:hypothetical protein
MHTPEEKVFHGVLKTAPGIVLLHAGPVLVTQVNPLQPVQLLIFKSASSGNTSSRWTVAHVEEHNFKLACAATFLVLRLRTWSTQGDHAIRFVNEFASLLVNTTQATS